MTKHFALVLICILLLGNKCTEVDVTDQRVADAINEINSTFRQGYQEVLANIGTRHFNVNRSVAFSGMRETLIKLGFTVINSESEYYLFVSAPAPKPLSEEEWKQVQNSDERIFKEIISKHLGLKGNFVKLEPEGLNINGFITFLETKEGVKISITFRLHEIKPQPPESILPRREYPPPTAARIGFQKIWQQFENVALPIARMATES
jgi:hypothetical protein